MFDIIGASAGVAGAKPCPSVKSCGKSLTSTITILMAVAGALLRGA